MDTKEICFKRDLECVWTQGLRRLGRRELKLRVDGDFKNAEALLRYVADYIISNDETLSPQETLAYGYWVLTFELADDGFLHLWGAAPDFSDFLPGAKSAMRYWGVQHEVCARFGADFHAPEPHQMVGLSDGLLEGDAVQGVRYPSPPDMSGLWITTDRYNGDVKTLKVEHIFHLTSIRDDLAPSLCLPTGHRFDFAQLEDVWYDHDVASEPVS